jgi:ElaB/YqjD/DUF883 family membrane-anchored ribosome-binding protein
MNRPETSAEKLDEALTLLNEVAAEKRDELQRLLSTKYTGLKSALGGSAQASAEWLKHKGTAAVDTAKDAAATVDESVHKHPWPYIGGVALGALIVGFLMGSARRDRA